jgi:hypothetical protein
VAEHINQAKRTVARAAMSNRLDGDASVRPDLAIPDPLRNKTYASWWGTASCGVTMCASQAIDDLRHALLQNDARSAVAVLERDSDQETAHSTRRFQTIARPLPDLAGHHRMSRAADADRAAE